MEQQKCQKEGNVWNNRSAKKEEKLKYGTTEVPKIRKNKNMAQQKCQMKEKYGTTEVPKSTKN